MPDRYQMSEICHSAVHKDTSMKGVRRYRNTKTHPHITGVRRYRKRVRCDVPCHKPHKRYVSLGVRSVSEFNDAAAANADINEDVFSGISIGLGAVCSAACGLIVAIPLMIANNGLDDSRLFG